MMKNKVIQKQLYEVTRLFHTYEMANRTHHEDGRNRDRDRILKVLKLKPGIQKSELAELFDLPMDMMKGMLKGLADDGYIVCNENPGNTNDRLLSLSEKGLQAWEELQQEKNDAKKIMDCLTDEEKKTFSQMLTTLSKALEQEVKDLDTEGFDFHGGHRRFHHQGIGHMGGGHGRSHHISRNRGECAGFQNCGRRNFMNE